MEELDGKVDDRRPKQNCDYSTWTQTLPKANKIGINSNNHLCNGRHEKNY